jgi:hypothetical protein
MGPERRFKAEQAKDLMNFGADTTEKDLADVERLLESL